MASFKSAPLQLSINAASSNINTNIAFYTQDYGTAKLEFAVFKDTIALDLTGAKASLTFVMADKSAFQVDATIDDAPNGQVSYVLMSDILSHFGRATAELNLYFDNNTKGLSAGQFSFTINQSLSDQKNKPAQDFYIESIEALKTDVSQAQTDMQNIKSLVEQNQVVKLADYNTFKQDTTTLLADIVTVHPNGVDDTSAIQSALDNGNVVRLLSGTYIVTSITLNDSAKILTSGYKTILKQKSGLTADIRILNIVGSNVVVDEMTYEGNISTDTGEQRHAVYIRNNSALIQNVTVKGIKVKNIRGDGLYIGGNTSYNPTNIKIGHIVTDNTYRNGFSITGGINIEIGNLYATRCGMMGFDLESDTQGGTIKNVKIGDVFCSNVGIIASGNSYPYIENVEIGFITCRASTKGSVPAFSQAVDTDKDGITFRNARNIKIKGLDIDGFNRFAINFLFSAGDRYNDNIEIDFLVIANCSLNDTTYNSYVNLGGVNLLKVNYVKSTTQTGKEVFKGSSKTAVEQNVIIKSSKHSGGRFASNCGLYAENLDVVSDISVLSSIKTLSRIINSKLNGTIIIGYSDNVILDGCNLIYSSAKESNGVNIYKNNVINGTFIA